MKRQDFDRPAPLHQILAWIQLTPRGREAVHALNVQQKTRPISWIPYPLEIQKKLREVCPPEHPLGACFENNGSQGSIRYSTDTPAAVQVVWIFHEMIHALDASLWNANRFSPNRKELILLAAEIHAFESQSVFVEELEYAVPEWKSFVKERFPELRVLHGNLSTSEVAALYSGVYRSPSGASAA